MILLLRWKFEPLIIFFSPITELMGLESCVMWFDEILLEGPKFLWHCLSSRLVYKIIGFNHSWFTKLMVSVLKCKSDYDWLIDWLSSNLNELVWTLIHVLQLNRSPDDLNLLLSLSLIKIYCIYHTALRKVFLHCLSSVYKKHSSHTAVHCAKLQKYNRAKYVGLQFFDMWCY